MSEDPSKSATKMCKCPPCWKWVVHYRKVAITIISPLVLLPLIFYIGTSQAKAAFVIILMACYWNFEVLPLGITALLPVVLVPILGVMPSRDLCPSYFKDSNMLFLGGLIMALSIEEWNLHKRIALKALLTCGVQPRWLLLGLLLPTWLLSMWISNTATVSMMLPIVDAVLVELRRHWEANRQRQEAAARAASASNPTFAMSASTGVLTDQDVELQISFPEKGGATPSTDIELQSWKSPDYAEAGRQPSQTDVNQLSAIEDAIDHEMGARTDAELRASMKDFLAEKKNAEFTKMFRMLQLAVAYAAVFGGLSTLTGTAPNVVLYGIVQEYFGADTSLNYSSWMFWGLPIAVITLLVAWIWLQIAFLGFRGLVRRKTLTKKDEERIKETLKREYAKLGSITYAEVNILVIFAVTIGLWIGREPGAPGWGLLFTSADPKATSKTMSFVADAQPSILAAIMLFLLPSQNPFRRCKCTSCGNQAGEASLETAEPPKSSRLMNWKAMQERLPWQIILLLGAGFALADMTRTSGLSDWVGTQLLALNVIPLEVLIFIICFFTSMMTELTTNSAAATILLPILASFAQKVRVHPFYFMIACTTSCSFGFVLPISTPANILVWSRGYLRIQDVMRTGIVLWLCSNSINAVLMIVYAPVIFQLREFPAWAVGRNRSAAASGLC